METIKILVSIHMIPDNNHITVFLFNNLLPVLRKRVNVKMYWLVYKPEKLGFENKDPDNILLDIHDFKDAVDVVEKIKPDLIFDHEHPSLIDFALDAAGKHFGIPVILGIYKDFVKKITFKMLITSYVGKFFDKSVYADTSPEQQKLMRRGKFFLYKYMFYLKTLSATKKNIFYILKYFFIVLRVHVKAERPFVDSRFANTLHWSPGEYFLEKYHNAPGYDESSFVLTGNPIYDEAFQKIKELKPSPNKGKINVLFLPHQFHSFGLWTKQVRDDSLKAVISEIQKSNELNLTVKIHPSSMILYEYEELVHSIDPNLKVHQKGNILDYLEEADVVVSYPSGSSALIFSLIAKKPILLCDFFTDSPSIFLEKNLALKCSDKSKIVESIFSILEKNPATEERRSNFIKELLYKSDGKSSERLADALLQLLEKNNLKKRTKM